MSLFPDDPTLAPPAQTADTDAKPAEPEPVDAVVSRVHVHKEDTGWTVMTVERAGMPESWVGVMPKLTEGMKVRATGEIEEGGKWGRQFRVHSLIVQMPSASDPDTLAAFLAKLVPGIGDRLAWRIVDTLGDETIAALEGNPEKVASVRGVSLERARALCEEWGKHSIEGQLIVQLARFGIRGALAKKVLKKYGSRAAEVCEKEPFLLAIEVEGVGWRTADTIAKAVGVPLDSLTRVQAGVLHAFEEEVLGWGHCFTDQGRLLAAAGEVLGLGPDKLLQGLEALEQRGRIVRDGPRIYVAGIYRAEGRAAERIARLLTAPGILRRWQPDFLDPLGDGVPEEEVPPADRMAELAADAVATFEARTGLTLAEVQRQAVHEAMRSKVLIITGGPGCGKCLGKGTKVLMANGQRKPVEEVVAGEFLMGDDSTPREVLTLTKGIGPLFRVTPIKGASWVCNDVHVLTLVRSDTGKVLDIPLNEYQRLSAGSKLRQKGKLFRVPANFPPLMHRPLLDPYIFGLWIGDGTLGEAEFTTADQEIVDALSAEARRLRLKTKKRWDTRGNCWSVDITSGKGKPNAVRRHLRSVSRRGRKHIPEEYLLASREERLRLLAGIVDTDGHHHGGVVEITTKWAALADEVAFLARSLGFAAYISSKPVELPSGERRIYHRVNLSGAGLHEIPCHLAWKCVAPRRQRKDARRTGFSVEPIGVGEYFGFELSGNGRFLLGDFTVTHNTTVSRAIIHALDAAGFDIALAAPTGRAAKRLSELTGRPASTIHRLLEYDPREGRFTRDATRPLEQTAILVDEVSMLDVGLAAHLLEAVDDGARLVLVGDVDQLPSVGPGAVLRDLIESEVLPVVRLTQIFRQAEGSRIVVNAHRVNRGQMPERGIQGQSDFFWIERTDPEMAKGVALRVITERLAHRGISTRDVVVISPQKTGAAGVPALNKVLQAALNPAGPCLTLGKAPKETIYRVGDRVMHLKNDYERGVYNGDVGWVSVVDGEKTSLAVDVDGREVLYERKHFEHLVHAYACTVHKMQGSQMKAVIILMLREHIRMLSRQLLYTALTRGEQLVVLIADPEAVRIAVSETRREVRNTTLKERLRAACATASAARTASAA